MRVSPRWSRPNVPRLGQLVPIAAAVTAIVMAAACSSTGDETEASPTTGRSDAATTTTTTTTIPGPLERYAGYASVSYGDDSHWLCRPGRSDICASNLDATSIAPDGTLTVETFVADPNPAIDCFYLYPTISRDPGPVSDWSASESEEGYVALNQAARLRAHCRVFAPVYRQRTLAAITSGAAGNTSTATDPYIDVLDAWKSYMAEDNDGRGVVLVGHSQGSALLSKLIAEEIDPNPDVRDRMVSAFLAGWGVRPESFDEVSLCTDTDQVGCNVTWATFRDTAPPAPGALFGRPRSGEGPAACTNPAALGGTGATHNYFPANRSASILGGGANADAGGPGSSWVDPPSGPITTPFVSLPGLIRTTCVERDGFGYLEMHVDGDPADPRADDIAGDLTPDWGMHLVDVNIVMGDVVDLIGGQAEAWLADH